MNYYLFTFRPQITEQELFEDFISLFIPHLKECENYSYSIEEDDTLQKHIHAIWSSKAKDKNACFQLFNKKIFKQFKKSLFGKQTNEPAGFDNQKVKEDDFLKVLGYVNKETSCRRREYSFKNEKILEAVKYYYACEHIDKSIKKSDLIILTSKNIHIHIKDYCEKQGLDVGQRYYVKHAMRADGYCFSQVGKVDETFRELEEVIYPERFEEEYNKKSYYTIEQELKEALFRIQKAKAQNPKLLI